MNLFGLEKLSLVDYDGKVAATVFTGACNFRCGFCQNSPLVTDVSSLDTLSEDEILSYLKKRKGILDGVCVTGGEPTLHKELPSFCEKLKNLGYSVKVDTNGTNPDMVKYLNQNGLADYFAMDIKNCKEKYSETIGIPDYDLSAVEKTVEYFLSENVDYEFRTTLIKEFHNISDIIKIGEWIRGAKAYALQKFKDSDTCITRGLHEVDCESANVFLQTIKNYVPSAKLRGY